MNPEEKAREIIEQWLENITSPIAVSKESFSVLHDVIEQALTLPCITEDELEAFKKEQFPEVPRSYEAAQWCCGIDLCFEWMQKKMMGSV